MKKRSGSLPFQRGMGDLSKKHTDRKEETQYRNETERNSNQERKKAANG